MAVLSIAPVAWADGSAAGPADDLSPVPAKARQLIVVRSASWSDVSATMQRFERSAGGPWKAYGTPSEVNLGRHGLAWGRGLQSLGEPGPIKKEGDLKSPAGVFVLGSAFGYEDGLPEGAKRYPYLHLRKGISCIEDRRSKFYNQVIDPSSVAHADWSARDPMLRADGLFRWGIIVEHNVAGTIPGAGSCIFMHIWRGPRKGTAGCTAMPAETIEETIRWLDPDERPVLVQLPESEYARLRTDWALP